MQNETRETTEEIDTNSTTISTEKSQLNSFIHKHSQKDLIPILCTCKKRKRLYYIKNNPGDCKENDIHLFVTKRILILARFCGKSTLNYSDDNNFKGFKNFILKVLNDTDEQYCYIVIYADSHLHTCTYICRIIHNDKDARRTQEDFFRKIFSSHFIARVRKGCSRFACERVLETEHKLHILIPLLWPSHCVFLVLLDAQPEVLGSTPSGLFWGPPRSGVAFPTTSRL